MTLQGFLGLAVLKQGEGVTDTWGARAHSWRGSRSGNIGWLELPISAFGGRGERQDPYISVLAGCKTLGIIGGTGRVIMDSDEGWLSWDGWQGGRGVIGASRGYVSGCRSFE